MFTNFNFLTAIYQLYWDFGTFVMNRTCDITCSCNLYFETMGVQINTTCIYQKDNSTTCAPLLLLSV